MNRPKASGSPPQGRAFRLTGSPGHDAAAPEDALALDLLAAEGFDPRPLPLASRFERAGAFRATAEPLPLGASLAARFGLIYIQDPSSMLPPLMLDPPPGACVLDMCASPGGKTGLLARLVGPEGFVLGNEPNAARLDTLRRNLARSGLLNTATCRHPGQDLPLSDSAWTHILCDPPCSGWGTADKHPRVMDMWTGDKTAPLIRLQRELLARAARLLAPGGRLLYSTCTTNPAENEDQVAWATAELGLSVSPLAAPGGFALREPSRPEARGSLCVSPEQGASQGFFLALLTRAGDALEAEPAPSGLIGEPLPRLGAGPADLSALPPGEIRLFGDKAVFLHAGTARLPSDLRWQGAPVGRVKGGSLHPDPLARGLCPPPAPADVVQDDVDLAEPADLTRLLTGQSLNVAGQMRFPILRFRGRALGWLRRKGRRVLWTGRG